MFAEQSLEQRIIVTQNGGLVSIFSIVDHPNPLNTYTYDWESVDNLLVDIDDDETTFTFDPSISATDICEVTLLVTGTLPIAQDGVFSVLTNQADKINVLENDTDADGDILKVVSATANLGSIELIDNVIHYTAISDYIGEDEVITGSLMIMVEKI